VTLRIVGGTLLLPGGMSAGDIAVAGDRIDRIGGDGVAGRELDAGGLLVLPGIVDIHGDAIERLIAPRPTVGFDTVTALLEADRQLAANGITTACHAVTWSWEGGQRGEATTRAILDALDKLKPHLAVATLFHLRHEIYNLEAEPTIIDWLAAGRIHCLAFNDHMAGTIKQRHRPDKMRGMIERSGLSAEAFDRLVERVHARADEVQGSIDRLAGAARRAGVPMLSHDDMSPEARDRYRAQGALVAEFPVNETTAAHAAEAGDAIVFGAPNVVRGGSHTGCPAAAEMARRGHCTALASDYFWPALPLAPFVLERRGDLPLAEAWKLVSLGPALALGLGDRGELAEGRRADIILAEPRDGLPPRIVATIAGGRLVHLADSGRLGG
jgi:alpha-D-ribose 1-methylphosphonate 5-triphosphate diphosphatase